MNGTEERRPRPRLLRLALRSSLLLVLLGLLVALLLMLPLESIPGWGWDFAVFRAGSQSILAGDNPYLPENILLHADGAELATIPYFVYAPHFGLLLAPLAFLPPELGSRLWFVANLAFAISSIALLSTVFQWKPGITALSLTFLIMALHPALRTLLGIGQSAGLLLFLISLAVYFLHKGNQTAAGLCLGLGLFKPHLALVLPFLAWRRQWRTLFISLGTFAAANIVFIALADDWVRSMVSVRSTNLAYGCLPFVSLPALINCLPSTVGVRVAGYGVMALLTFLTVILLAAPTNPRTQRYALQVSLILVLTVLLVDNVRVADTVLLLPAIVAILALAPRMGSKAMRYAVIFLLALGVIFPLVTDAMGTVEPMWKMPVFHSIGSLAIAASLLVVSATQRGRDPEMG